ncbi:baseplate J/gp47 family protein [Desulfovibrio sp.]|uniref:baseplate J/gp47 family protein n=1 Tax=Desulfovibrio sp. TaxID=885 RepID=UPI003D10F237
MPFERPTLTSLIARTQADIDSRLDGEPYQRRRLLAILARMEGGVAHGLYGYLDWQALQIMPDTAEMEHLERWSSIWGVPRKAATKAGLANGISFAAADGTILPAGTQMQRTDGVLYEVQADAVAAGGTVSPAIVAMDAGEAANADAGVALTLTSPVLGITATAVTSAPITGGADVETDASLRNRLMARIRTLPSGGAAQDYVTWALSVAGVTRAWCYPGEMGRGSVTVRFAMDATYDNGIPLAADVARVKSYIDSVRPVTADVYVVAPVPVPINCNLRITPDTPRLRVLVAEAVWAALRRDATPGGTVIVSRLNEAISLVDGEDDHVLISPAANIQLAVGHLAVPGTIVWED